MKHLALYAGTYIWVQFLGTLDPGSILARDVSRDILKNSGVSQIYFSLIKMCVSLNSTIKYLFYFYSFVEKIKIILTDFIFYKKIMISKVFFLFK